MKVINQNGVELIVVEQTEEEIRVVTPRNYIEVDSPRFNHDLDDPIEAIGMSPAEVESVEAALHRISERVPGSKSELVENIMRNCSGLTLSQIIMVTTAAGVGLDRMHREAKEGLEQFLRMISGG